MKKYRGFTLIELLVVVAILALLISILLPSLNRAREQSKLVKCGANLRGIFQSCVIYAAQNQDIVLDGKSGYTRPDFNNSINLLGFGETLYIDGALRGKAVTGNSLAGLSPVHYPVLRWSAEYGSGNVTGNNMFTCPASGAGTQFTVLTAGANATYGLSPWAVSHLDKKASDGTPIPIVNKMSTLLPGKIFGADGGYNMATYRYTSQPGVNQFPYWVYLRHFVRDTKNSDNRLRFEGTANYVFSDGHVEPAKQDKYYKDVPAIYASGKWEGSIWYQNPTGRLD